MNKKNLLMVTSIVLSFILFIVGNVIWPYLGWLIDPELISKCIATITFILLIASFVLFLRAVIKKISFMNFLYIIPLLISFMATCTIYAERYDSCWVLGDCLYRNSTHGATLYSNTGKYIKGSYYIEYQGEDKFDSGYSRIDDMFIHNDICIASGGPYFYFIETVKNELDSYPSYKDYKSYTLCFSFSVYNKSGDFIDASEFYIRYKYNESEGKYRYNYETYYSYELDELEDIIRSDIEDKINNYITKNAKKSQNNESLNNNSNSNKSSSTSTKKPKTRTISEPVKEWRDCVSCLGSGLCKYCGGSGVIYYPNGPQQCAACGGFGRCTICAGKGGEYHIEYVQRTETYYE